MFEASDNVVVILVQLVAFFLLAAWAVACFVMPFMVWQMREAVQRMERRQREHGEAVLVELRRITGGGSREV